MLEARDIHKSYGNTQSQLRVLRGINISVPAGGFIAIVGPSGAGKSTLLHILGGLDTPDTGELIFDGRQVYSLSDSVLGKIRNSEIGFVFQFYHLLSEFTVLENVMMPARVYPGINRASDYKERALSLLKEVGLSQRLHHFPNQLSGGEKQRVAIARALINEPRLLLCDEPTGNLDSETGLEIISLIKKASLRTQMTVILVTHNTELTNFCDRAYNLRDGILVS